MGLLFILKQFHRMLFPVAILWQVFSRCLTFAFRPWCNLSWFCLNKCLSLWSRIMSTIKNAIFLPIQIYNSMRCQIQMHMEYKQRNTELAKKLKQVISECNKLKQILKDSEVTRHSILKKYELLQLHVAILEEENNSLKQRTQKVCHDASEKNAVTIKRHNGDHSPLPEVDMPSKHLKLAGTNNMETQSVSVKMKSDAHESALSSCMFNVLLSLLVGVIVWHAEEPCTPLVVSVFIIACGSWKSTAESLLSSDNGLGLEGVALLSLNWFVLGALAYPVLPIFTPVIAKFGHWLFRSFGFFTL